MSNLLEELSNLEDKKNYSIVLNGIGCFIFLIKEKLKDNNIKKYEHLFDFKLTRRKEIDNKYFILEFEGKTQLEQKEIVHFLLELTSYKTETFKPQLLTIGIRKEKYQPCSLIVVEKKRAVSGEVRQAIFKNFNEGVEIAIIGDYFFQSYEDYQKTLQRLVGIWINN